MTYSMFLKLKNVYDYYCNVVNFKPNFFLHILYIRTMRFLFLFWGLALQGCLLMGGEALICVLLSYVGNP
jgi:hypothetical protein